MAVDCHDCYACDFHCQDCLADETKDWFRKTKNIFSDHYNDYINQKKLLSNIVAYSAAVGRMNVRYEMSGEGNPDLYMYRNELIEYAYNLGMKPVYISSGSAIDSRLCRTLVKYCSYIRISLPGITDQSYRAYSGQDRFLFKDAVKLLRNIVALRKQYNREQELLIGARCCLRPDIIDDLDYVSGLLLDDIGVDSFQIVKAIVNEGLVDQTMLIPKSVQKTLNKLCNRPQVDLPSDLHQYYNFRETEEPYRGLRCFAAEMTPILYGQFLLPCTHTWIIKDVNNVGVDLSVNGVSSLYKSAQECSTCCAINDNTLFNRIYQTVKGIIDSGKIPEFRCY